MPESSFFDPMMMGGGSFNPPASQADPAFSAGYRNIYGTRVGGRFSPVSNQGELNLQFPVGDHQRQFFLTGDAYVRPGSSMNAPADYGFKLGFKKNIEPRSMSAGDAINTVLQQQMGQPREAGPVLNADNRESFMGSLSPEQLKLLSQGVKKVNRDYKDAQLGIRPGAEKYGFDVGVDVRNMTPMGTQMGTVSAPAQFLNEFVEDRGMKESTAPLNPNFRSLSQF